MKKIYLLVIGLLSFLSFGQTIFSESFGTTAPTASPFPAVSAYTGYQNAAPIVFSGTSSVRTSGTLSNYVGASGSSHVYMGVTASVGQVFQIDGINTSAFQSANLVLSFGYLKNGSANPQLVVEVSTNGTTWTPITFTDNTNTSWNLVTITPGSIPASSTLSIRFTNPSTTSGQIRLDDVKLVNASGGICPLTLSNPVVACLTSTSNIDNYTVTIPYTGGGTTTYAISTSGAISGDNPSTVAAGNIVVTFTEGNSYSITVTSTACNFPITGTSPDFCIETNALPVSEPFNYTQGTALNTSQKWKNTSTGADEILAVTGNLTYPGINSTGNSVAFAGTGSDTLLPFTDTTSGELFTSFLVSVTDLTGISTTGQTYFAVLSNASNTFSVARIYFKTDGTTFQYGLSPTITTTDIVWSSSTYSVGTTQYLVLRYDFTNNLLGLYVNPTIGGTGAPAVVVSPATALTSLANFILRQDSPSATPAMKIDELSITTTPNFTLSNSSNTINGLSIYPNPVKNGLFYINTEANTTKSVRIFDMIGKEVLTTSKTDAVNVSGLNKGLYVVQITENGNTAVQKLIIE
ncbi:T9SS type A sorting domain-containing protein [Flavobacterium sp.]|uniref:T9SS type A sorting domain-containing protein n=1 Tax=Flavobacterium sp. TaxID=239 RepID=UPI0026380825|nr:T9SS type A sorting domain-containing protein [Flavobacterium sp.]